MREKLQCNFKILLILLFNLTFEIDIYKRTKAVFLVLRTEMKKLFSIKLLKLYFIYICENL